MEELKVCRICLVMDVKLFDLQDFPLGMYLEPIIGINPLSSMDLPSYACFQCAHLIKKYYHFRECCLLGQSVLYSILQTSGKITRQELTQVDRVQLNLCSKLTNHVVPDCTVDCSKDEPKLVSGDAPYSFQLSLVDEQDIKCELEVPEPASQNLDYGDYVKLEDNGSHDNGCHDDGCHGDGINSLSSDDDEPLSLHRSQKEKRKGNREKKKVRKGRKKICDGTELGTLEKAETLELPHEPESIDPPKKKRGRPRKETTIAKEGCGSVTKVKRERRTINTGGVADDDIDLEEFVTIIKLSLEEQKADINGRQQSSNYLNAPFQCGLCYKGFIDSTAWDHHKHKHHPSAGDVECEVCKFRFKSRRALQKHAANHERKYACKACTYVSKTTTQAKQHQRWHKGVTYKCQYCDEVSTKWTSYLSHVRIKHPSEFICGVCGYSFVSQLGLAMHKTMMHKEVKEAGDGPHCAECSVTFVSSEAYQRHMVTSAKHARSKDFSTGCRVCGSTFSCSEELRLHHRREHARRRPRNYGKKASQGRWPAPCEHCSEVIPSAREYWTHFRRAHPDKSYPIQKDYVCDICGKSFRGNAFLVYHKRTHSTERAYQCGQCPKAFFNRTNLQMHEKTHSDSRPYPCNVCFKAFKSKGALDRHFRSHTGVKPYQCEVCGKSFGQSNSRKLHVRTVHLRQAAPYLSKARLNTKGRGEEGWELPAA